MKRIILLLAVSVSLCLYAETFLTDDFLIKNTFSTSGEFFGADIVFSKNSRYEIRWNYAEAGFHSGWVFGEFVDVKVTE